MLKYLKSLIAFLFAVCVSLTLFLFAEKTFSDDFNACSRQYISQPTADERGQPGEKNHGGSSAIVMANLRCSFDFIDKHNGGMTALATLIMAAFTGTLWWAAAGQYDLMEKNIEQTGESIALARAEFISTHRPRITVRQVTIMQMTGGVPIVLRYVLVNAGGTAATIIEQGHTIFLSTKDGPYGPAMYERGTVWKDEKKLVSGQTVDVGFGDKVAVMPADVAAVDQGEKALFLFGYVSYRDEGGTVRRTGFLRRYDREIGRFRIVPDPDFEYED